MSQKKNYLYVVGRQDAAHYFFLLGHCERLAILETLGKFGATSFRGLLLNSPLSKSSLTQHIQQLRRAGLVRPCRIGKGSGYAINTEATQHAYQVMADYLKNLNRAEHSNLAA
jgi:DNA-binding transcriptional ArsR family regulator